MCFGLMCILTKIFLLMRPRSDFPEIWEGRAAVLSAVSTSNINVFFSQVLEIAKCLQLFLRPAKQS